MDNINHIITHHSGRKVEGIRKLRGWTQAQLGDRLNGITKQAVSKIEQSEKLDDAKLMQIAEALEVTFEGLKNFSEERVLYNTINFYENCGVTATSISANVENVNNPMEKMIELYERMLVLERQRYDDLLKRI